MNEWMKDIYDTQHIKYSHFQFSMPYNPWPPLNKCLDWQHIVQIVFYRHIRKHFNHHWTFNLHTTRISFFGNKQASLVPSGTIIKLNEKILVLFLITKFGLSCNHLAPSKTYLSYLVIKNLECSCEEFSLKEFLLSFGKWLLKTFISIHVCTLHLYWISEIHNTTIKIPRGIISSCEMKQFV